MGLDSFKTDDEDNDDTSESQQEDEETTSSDEPSGLDAFRTDASRGGSTTDNDSDKEEQTIHGIPPRDWNQMSKDDRVRHVRQHSIPDYYPDYQPDDRWDYERCIEIRCVCGSRFTFLHAGICLDCGRAYEDAGRTVVKRHDPHPEETEDNARSQDN